MFNWLFGTKSKNYVSEQAVLQTFEDEVSEGRYDEAIAYIREHSGEETDRDAIKSIILKYRAYEIVRGLGMDFLMDKEAQLKEALGAIKDNNTEYAVAIIISNSDVWGINIDLMNELMNAAFEQNNRRIIHVLLNIDQGLPMRHIKSLANKKNIDSLNTLLYTPVYMSKLGLKRGENAVDVPFNPSVHPKIKNPVNRNDVRYVAMYHDLSISDTEKLTKKIATNWTNGRFGKRPLPPWSKQY